MPVPNADKKNANAPQKAPLENIRLYSYDW